MSAEQINEIVRITQNTVPGHCYKCDSTEIAFICVKCLKQYCSIHAFSTYGICPDCPLW